MSTSVTLLKLKSFSRYFLKVFLMDIRIIFLQQISVAASESHTNTLTSDVHYTSKTEYSYSVLSQGLCALIMTLTLHVR